MMSSTEDNSILTQEEEKIANRSLYGISEMLNSIMSRYTSKDYAISLCGPHRQSTKSRARTAVLDYISSEEHGVKEEPRHILKKLPADLHNIAGSDLTDILRQFCKTFFLSNEREKPNEDRGRPKEPGFDQTDSGGRYSCYKTSEYLEEVVSTLRKPEVGRIIDELLIEGGLLHKYQKYIIELLYYLIQICEDKFWNIVKDFRFIDLDSIKRKPEVLRAFLDKIKTLDENELKREAEKASLSSLGKLGRGKQNFFIFVIAGVVAIANRP